MCRSYLIITDSGGIQEEAPSLGKPVLVTRDNTERPEALSTGTVKLVGTNRAAIVAAANELLRDQIAYAKATSSANPYGDGNASVVIANAIECFLGAGKSNARS
jgi:UDP-N-acetylglucosamine 2-epimerase (non-hydrolysing)